MIYKKSIIPYCEAHHAEVFTDSDISEYVEEQTIKIKEGGISHDYVVQQRRAAALLADCMQSRTLAWGKKTYGKARLCECFEKILVDYHLHLSQSLSPCTVQNRVNYVRQFLVFLEKKHGVLDFRMLTSESVRDFITTAAPNHKASMPNLTCAIKNFLSFLNDSRLAAIDAGRYLVNPAPGHKKLHPCFTDDEAEAIINSVDRSTPLGKRDYAIMKTALWTGLRGSDIIGLKRSDIDWRRKVINVAQDKTEVCIRIELSSGVGNAIADYIMNGRPDADSPYIFVRHIRPYDRLGVSGEKNIIKRYLEKAGVLHKAGDGKTFHAFRRTMGTRLVRAGVPILSVGEMLGHANPNSAKQYVALDIDRLRVCCLDISMFKTQKGGLV